MRQGLDGSARMPLHSHEENGVYRTQSETLVEYVRAAAVDDGELKRLVLTLAHLAAHVLDHTLGLYGLIAEAHDQQFVGLLRGGVRVGPSRLISAGQSSVKT